MSWRMWLQGFKGLGPIYRWCVLGPGQWVAVCHTHWSSTISKYQYQVAPHSALAWVQFRFWPFFQIHYFYVFVINYYLSRLINSRFVGHITFWMFLYQKISVWKTHFLQNWPKKAIFGHIYEIFSYFLNCYHYLTVA